MRRILSCLFLAASAGLASAQGWDCPPMESSVSVGSYQFSYKSWAWRGDDGAHRLAHCIRNESSRSLFVDWTETALKGFVRPNATSYVTTSYPEPKFALIDSTLWYGALPSSVQVEALRYDETIVAAEPAPQPIETISRTSFPIDGLGRFRSEQEMRRAVAANPRLLREISMGFSSSVDPVSGRIRYSCSYAIGSASDGSSSGPRWADRFLMGFSDPALNVIMFGTSEPVAIVGGRPSGVVESESRSVLTEGDIIVFLAEAPAPSGTVALRSGRLIFYAPARFSAAELPVHYHAR